MIAFEANNEIRNYEQIGFNRRITREFLSPFKKDRHMTSLESDSLIEGVGANKILSNQLNSVINLGLVVLDGTKGAVMVKDKAGRVIGVMGSVEGL